MTPRSDIPASPSQALDDKRICRDIYATALMSLLIPPLIGGTTMGLVGYYPLPELYLIFLSHSGIYVLAVGIGVLLSARTACRWITGLPRLRDAASLVRAQKRLARLPWLMLGFLAVYSAFGALSADLSLDRLGIRHYDAGDHAARILGSISATLIAGFPIFFFLADRLGRYLAPRGVVLNAIPLSAKVIMLGLATPVLIDTVLIGYYSNLHGELNTTALLLWLGLLALAALGTYLAWHSFMQGIRPLQDYLAGQGQGPAGISAPVARTVDELGLVAANWAKFIERDNVMLGENQAARRRTQNLLQIIENAQDLIASADVDGNLIYINNAGRQMLGIAENENVIGEHIANFHRPQAIAKIQNIAFPACHAHGYWHGENEFRRRDGSLLIGEQTIVAHRNDGGEITQYSTITRDITQQKLAEKALKEKEAHLSRLYESMRDAYVQVDMDGLIVDFNPAYQEMLGYTPAELKRLRYTDLTPERWHALEQGIVDEQILPHGFSEVYEKEYKRKDGLVFPVELRTFLLRGEDLQPSGMWAIVRDISERKAAEEDLKQRESLLAEAQKIAHIGSWELDLMNNRLTWSDEIFSLFEIDQEKFGASYEAFLHAIHPDDRDMVNAAYTESLKNRTPYTITHRLMMPDGRIKHVVENCHTEYDKAGHPLRSIGTVQDVTERHEAEKQIHLMARVFESSGEAILITDPQNKVMTCNMAFTQMTGYSQQEILGHGPDFLAANLESRLKYEEVEGALSEVGYWQGEIMDRRKDGATYPKWCTATTVRDEKNAVTHHIYSFADISEHKAAQSQIYHLAHHDALTGLPNRFTLTARLNQAIELAHRNREKIAVMFLDLDRFKVINDTLGHHVGDQLLIEVASRLRDCVRDSDIVARLGGDEFVVVLTEVEDAVGASHVGENILRALGTHYRIEGQELHSSPSIGISFYPDDGLDVGELMKNADTAMYHAKSAGRNNYQFFRQEMNHIAHERLELEHDLRQAIAQRQFRLYYQPQINIDTGKVIGVEALIRWEHPGKGLISPAKFIPIAEETGLILPIGEWVLREACRQARQWADHGIDGITVSINISSRQFHQKTLPMLLAATIVKAGIEPSVIELEITEGVAMDNPQETTETLWMLRGIGVNLAIDDFGTGYSSLNYLKLFPINRLKIDRSFVKDIETDPNDAAICSATISLAHNLGLEVIAEGVENEKQLEYLKNLDCEHVQGYFFSPALDPDAAAAYIAATNRI